MDGLGNPLRFVLTAGQVHDSTQARALVEGLTGAYLLADKAYDSNEFRDVIVTGAKGRAGEARVR